MKSKKKNVIFDRRYNFIQNLGKTIYGCCWLLMFFPNIVYDNDFIITDIRVKNFVQTVFTSKEDNVVA